MGRTGTWAGALVVAAMAAAVVATRHAHPADGSPIDPGAGWTAVWIGSTAVAFATYAAAALAAGRTALRLRTAVAVAVVVQLLPLAAPLLLSRDVYLYWAEARVVTVHHASPYRATPSDYPQDPSTPWASAQWRTQAAPYGPGWVVLGAGPALAAGTSHHAAAYLYRLLAAAGIVASIAVLARRTRSARSVILFGWSPLLALHFAGGGHTDAWIALSLIVGVVYGGTATGGSAWALGASVKAVPAIVLPLELARTRLRFAGRFWAGLLGVGAAIAVVSTIVLGPRWATASAIGAHGTSPIGGVHLLTSLGLRHRYAVAAGGLVFLAVYALLLRTAWRTGRARRSLAATALCLCASLLRPWYAVWPLALAAVEDDLLAEVLALALAAYVFFWDAVPL